MFLHTHTHTHTRVCVCVCVNRVNEGNILQSFTLPFFIRPLLFPLSFSHVQIMFYLRPVHQIP